MRKEPVLKILFTPQLFSLVHACISGHKIMIMAYPTLQAKLMDTWGPCSTYVIALWLVVSRYWHKSLLDVIELAFLFENVFLFVCVYSGHKTSDLR